MTSLNLSLSNSTNSLVLPVRPRNSRGVGILKLDWKVSCCLAKSCKTHVNSDKFHTPSSLPIPFCSHILELLWNPSNSRIFNESLLWLSGMCKDRDYTCSLSNPGDTPSRSIGWITRFTFRTLLGDMLRLLKDPIVCLWLPKTPLTTSKRWEGFYYDI